MELAKRVLALVSGRDRGLEGGASAAAKAVRLIPELPIWTLNRIDLFEGKVPPVYAEAIAQDRVNVA